MPIPRRIVLILATAAATACSNDPLPAETPPTVSPDARVDSSGVGLPCDLPINAGPQQAVFNNQALQCPSRLCLKPIDQVGGVNTGALCSAVCSTDSDCIGSTRDASDPSDRRCAGGYACAVAFVVGPLCCQKLCLCTDFLAGPVQTPSVCDRATDSGIICYSE
jgi:hypothetical protein